MQHARDRIRFVTMQARWPLRSRKSWGTSTCSCAAEPAISGTGTPPTPWTRSELRVDAVGAVRGPAASMRPGLRLRPALPIAQPARFDLPEWHSRHPQAQPGLAGQAVCTSTPRSAASSTAHRRAAADSMDPSNPTTIISLLLRLAMRPPVLPPASVPAARHLKERPGSAWCAAARGCRLPNAVDRPHERCSRHFHPPTRCPADLAAAAGAVGRLEAVQFAEVRQCRC